MEVINMTTSTLSKKRRLINYLYQGGGMDNGITANEARAKFGVANLRATISDVKNMVETFGNWEIVSEETATGKTRYFMVDTHPGKRTYAYDADGSRYSL
jgi:hypothetical protein|tara:strand:+ start:641 stop:940 length:300 start_codon:yes stop_codon:yes gene_type:complete